MAQRLSQIVALRCKDPVFQTFLQVKTEVSAVHILRRICMIESRAELDHDKEAAQRYHRLIGIPFSNFINDLEHATCSN